MADFLEFVQSKDVGVLDSRLPGEVGKASFLAHFSLKTGLLLYTISILDTRKGTCESLYISILDTGNRRWT